MKEETKYKILRSCEFRSSDFYPLFIILLAFLYEITKRLGFTFTSIVCFYIFWFIIIFYLIYLFVPSKWLFEVVEKRYERKINLLKKN